MSLILGTLLIVPSRQLPGRRSGVFIVNFEHISHLALVFLLLTLNRTRKDKLGGEVTLLGVRNSELEWLKFEQHFIIQDRKFEHHFIIQDNKLKKKLSLIKMTFLCHKRALIKLKASFYKKVNQWYLDRTVILRNLLY